MNTRADRPAISRRSLLTGGGALAAAMFLPGCGSGGGSEGSAGGGIKILGAGAKWTKGEFLWRMVEDFKKLHPGSQVDVVSAGQKFKQLFSSMASAGTFPDVIFGGGGGIDLPTMLQQKWALSLDGDLGLDIKNRLPAGMWVDGITTADGHIYSFVEDDRRGTYLQYNTAIMKQAGLDPAKPPRTWTELIAMSQQIMAKVKGVGGIALPLKAKNGFDMISASYGWAHPTVSGGGLDYRTGRYAHDVIYLEAFEMLLRLRDTKVLHADSATLDAAGSDAYFNTGKVAFSLVGPWAARVNNRQKFTDWGITTMPVEDTTAKPLLHGTLASAAYFAVSKTKNTELVKQLMDFLSSAEVIKRAVTEDAATALDPQITIDNAPVPQLKAIAEIQKTVVQPPVPAAADPKALKVDKAETALAPPRKDWWQIGQGALAGKVPTWKDDLAKFNAEMNKRFDTALKNAEADRSMFVFSNWSGTENFPLKTSVGS